MFSCLRLLGDADNQSGIVWVQPHNLGVRDVVHCLRREVQWGWVQLALGLSLSLTSGSKMIWSSHRP